MAECRAQLAEAVSRKDWPAARLHSEQLLALSPGDPDGLHALGMVSWGEGNLELAAGYVSAALHTRPDPAWFNNLGVLYSVTKQWPEAIAAFRRSLEIEPDASYVRLHLALALCKAGQWIEAIDVLSTLLAAQPDNAKAWTTLGRAYLACGETRKGHASLVRALELQPDSPETLSHLADACLALQQFGDAYTHALRLTELNPGSESFARLAVTSWEIGNWTEAAKARDTAFTFGITDPQLHSALLLLSLYDPAETGMSQYKAHRLWAVTHCPVWPRTKHFSNAPVPDRRLRIGFVTSELLTTPSRRFIAPLLQHLDAAFFETHIYTLSPETPFDSQLLPGVRRSSLQTLSDEQAAEAIRNDGIDVLVDCSGHQSYGRLSIFGLRPAPVQVAYSGYPGTSGLGSMDALFTDSILTPDGSEAEYSEPLVRLPGGRFLYQSPVDGPEVSSLPALSNRFVTFGIFQRGAKLNPVLLKLVSSVMACVPDSRLLIHHADPDYDYPLSSTIRRIRAAFSCLNIHGNRLTFIGRRSEYEHLVVVGSVDIALDSVPYNGQATTCDCLWMGVPVVTQIGSTHAGRVTASLLAQLGLHEHAGKSELEYVAIAAALSQDWNQLAELRGALRTKMSASGLTDIRARTREFETECRRLWTNWCSRTGAMEVA